MKKLLGALLACVAINVSAAPLDIVGGTSTTLPNTWYDFNGNAIAPNEGDAVTTFTGDEANAGEGIYLQGSGPVTYTYLGSEAYNTNESQTAVGGSFFSNKVSTVGDTFTTTDSGALDFGFYTKGEVTTEGTIWNTVGGFAADGFTALDGLWLTVFKESDYSLILMFGDGLGDSDFDDMIVRVSSVPIPAAVWLFGSVLMGFFGLRSRAKAK